MRNSPSNPLRTSAFTLTEVLVVVAVIALVAAFLVPTAKNSIDNAQAARCTSNLRQIGIAMHGYASENNQEFPKAYPVDNTPWMWKLIPYTDMSVNSMGPAPLPRSAGIFSCAAFVAQNAQRSVSYAYNTFVANSVIEAGLPWNYRRNIVPSPSKTFLLVEINSNGEFYSPISNSDVTRRHPHETANFLFVDGHVESLKEKVPLSDPRWKGTIQ